MNDDSLTPASEKMSGVSRRTVVKGAAWSVPAVILATAAPAAATATGNVIPLSVSGSRRPGNGNVGRVDFTVLFSNTSPGPHTVNWSMPALPPIAVGAVGWSPQSGSFVLPAGATSFTFLSRAYTVISVLGVVQLGVPQNTPNSTTITFTVVGHPPTVARVAPITGP